MAEQCRTTRVAMLSLAVALALAGVATLLGLMGTLAEAYAAPYTLRYVSATTGDDGPPVNYCTQRTNPCRTIQYAIYRANPGDVILVATGIYSDMVGFPAPAGYPGQSQRHREAQHCYTCCTTLFGHDLPPLVKSATRD